MAVIADAGMLLTSKLIGLEEVACGSWSAPVVKARGNLTTQFRWHGTPSPMGKS